MKETEITAKRWDSKPKKKVKMIKCGWYKRGGQERDLRLIK